MYVTKTDSNTIQISGRIDTTNAKEFEEKMLEAIKDTDGDLSIDASELEYVSSAGLRVFLKVKKAVKTDVNVINVTPEVYDIFEVTGFNSLLNVSKKIREVSIEGCEVIGEGANGKVYRLDDETIIKVFNEGVPLDVVKQERDFAQAAFVGGVPTAISYDTVKCGNSYGTVYEMLNADTVGATIRKNPERVEELGTRMGKLLKELHSIKADKTIFSDMLEEYKNRTEKMKKYITNDEYEKLMKVYNALPKRETILHGDFHAKNIMLVDEELMFIDMGDVGYGHPLLDLGGSYLALVNIGRLNPDIVEHYTGMNYDLCLRLWDAMLKEYFGTVDIEICKKVIRTFGEAKYALTPAFYTKATDEMAMNLLGRIRKTGILADDYDISFTLENIKTIFGNEE